MPESWTVLSEWPAVFDDLLTSYPKYCSLCLAQQSDPRAQPWEMAAEELCARWFADLRLGPEPPATARKRLPAERAPPVDYQAEMEAFFATECAPARKVKAPPSSLQKSSAALPRETAPGATSNTQAPPPAAQLKVKAPPTVQATPKSTALQLRPWQLPAPMAQPKLLQPALKASPVQASAGAPVQASPKPLRAHRKVLFQDTVETIEIEGGAQNVRTVTTDGQRSVFAELRDRFCTLCVGAEAGARDTAGTADGHRRSR